MENLKQRHRDLAREKYADIVQAIMDGKVAVKVERVSKSGMTRKMSFYLPNFQRITREIAEMTEWSVDKNGWLIVGGCGMDMCFHALYCALPYELSTKRSQRYTTL